MRKKSVSWRTRWPGLVLAAALLGSLAGLGAPLAAVSAAATTLTGHLLAPGGGTNFAAPNRVWVRAANDEGQGDTVQADPGDGSFTVEVEPGNNHLRLVFENPLWAAPTTLAGSDWYVDPDQTIDVGSLQLVEKQALISGHVVDQNSLGVADIPVRAWRRDGSEVAMTLSGAGGAYALPVISGTWELRAVPPLTSTYVTADSPQRVVLHNDTDTAIQNLRIILADVTVNGSVVDSDGLPLPALHGRAYALLSDHGRWRQLGPTVPIENGVFTLHLAAPVSARYRIGAYFPPEVGYSALALVPIEVTAGETLSITLPAAPNNSTISGHFNDQIGQPQLGLAGAVYAASNSGGTARDRLNPLDGSYALDVVSTDTSGGGGSFWWLRAFVDRVSGYVVQPPRTQKVFLPFNDGDGSDATVDFTVAQLDAWIHGTVTDPQGIGVPGALVSLHQLNIASGLGFNDWVLTDGQGDYAAHVPAGAYLVRASKRNMISPLPRPVIVPSGGNATADLHFRAKNAVISGQVTYLGLPHTAFVRAYSDSGAHVFTVSGPQGRYALGVNAGENWHVQAVSEESAISGTVTVTTFLKSPRVEIDPGVGVSNTADLALAPSDTLPDALVLEFNAADDQFFTLSNGSQVIVPAGAMVAAGPVVLFVDPLTALADDGGAQPVSFGYRLQAFDGSHLPITHFIDPVTLAIPFSAAQLAELGVGPDQLVPSYWDQATSSWKPVPAVSVVTDANGDGVVYMSVDHFTDFALMAVASQYRLSLPQVVR
ncbi:MAG: carboxypeptidase-like regulatory domain-containing protein [Anaerolineales bacterium]